MSLAIVIDATLCAMTDRWILDSFKRGLEYAGFLTLLWSVFSVFGGLKVRGFEMPYARTVGPDDMHQSTRRDAAGLLGTYAQYVLFGIAGGLLFVLSVMLPQ